MSDGGGTRIRIQAITGAKQIQAQVPPHTAQAFYTETWQALGFTVERDDPEWFECSPGEAFEAMLRGEPVEGKQTDWTAVRVQDGTIVHESLFTMAWRVMQSPTDWQFRIQQPSNVKRLRGRVGAICETIRDAVLVDSHLGEEYEITLRKL